MKKDTNNYQNLYLDGAPAIPPYDDESEIPEYLKINRKKLNKIKPIWYCETTKDETFEVTYEVV